ncbi:MAG TPA: PhzF family phenazine biosynthesis protein [Jatrophihabitans sp.]|nr:PhzF family phenazine biosynthesis protein [Jatrophihabitans sp.]
MSSLRIRIVDAFTDRPFTGNQAAVLRLDQVSEPPPDRWLSSLAAEMNLAETAFVLPPDPDSGADFGLRWFTPTIEVALCGHATLASAHCLFADGLAGPVRFATRSGVLTVQRLADGTLAMDFPAQPPEPIEPPDGLLKALGVDPVWVGWGGTDYLVEVADAQTVRNLKPDLATLATLPARGVIVTAGSDVPEADFVSRFFGPATGVPEDSVTGSAHTVLGPYWAPRVGLSELTGLQVSARTGLVGVRLAGDRVLLIGRAVTVLDGQLDPAVLA